VPDSGAVSDSTRWGTRVAGSFAGAADGAVPAVWDLEAAGRVALPDVCTVGLLGLDAGKVVLLVGPFITGLLESGAFLEAPEASRVSLVADTRCSPLLPDLALAGGLLPVVTDSEAALRPEAVVCGGVGLEDAIYFLRFKYGL